MTYCINVDVDIYHITIFCPEFIGKNMQRNTIQNHFHIVKFRIELFKLKNILAFYEFDKLTFLSKFGVA